MVNDRTQSAQVKKNNRAEEWLKNAVKDKHVRLIPFSEISKVKYNVAKGGSGTIHLGAWRNMHVAIKEQHNTNDLIKEVRQSTLRRSYIPMLSSMNHPLHVYQSYFLFDMCFVGSVGGVPRPFFIIIIIVFSIANAKQHYTAQHNAAKKKKPTARP
jgi:hypothetical protein